MSNTARPMRLLLTDDKEINREIALMVLEDMGFTLDTAVNGQEAVDKVSASGAGYYDAVLMDIQMPVMNGYEAAQAVRAHVEACFAREAELSSAVDAAKSAKAVRAIEWSPSE